MSALRFSSLLLVSAMLVTGCAYDPQIAIQSSREPQSNAIVGPQLPKPGKPSAFDKQVNRERPLPTAKKAPGTVTTVSTAKAKTNNGFEPPEPSPAGVPTATEDLTLPKPETATASGSIAVPDMAKTETKVEEAIAVDVTPPPVESPAPVATPAVADTADAKPAVAETPSAPAVPPAGVETTVSPSSATPASIPVAEVPAPAPTESAPVIAPELQQATVAVVETKFGKITIELDELAAPVTVDNFRKLALAGFYDGTTFHRIIPDFMIQGGDPNSKNDDRATHGKGGPEYTLQPEIKLKHKRGSVAMARLPDNVNPLKSSNGSQFYICIIDCPFLDGQYTVFGTVTSGMDVVDKISTQPRDGRDNPTQRIEMKVALVPKGATAAADSAPAVAVPVTTKAPTIDTTGDTKP